MEPVTLQEIDNENSSFFDSDNFKELSSGESFEITVQEESSYMDNDQNPEFKTEKIKTKRDKTA